MTVRCFKFQVSNLIRLSGPTVENPAACVDAAGTTVYAYTAGGQMWTEDLPPPKPGFGRQAAHVSATP
jgi:hypothetical protein